MRENNKTRWETETSGRHRDETNLKEDDGGSEDEAGRIKGGEATTVRSGSVEQANVQVQHSVIRLDHVQITFWLRQRHEEGFWKFCLQIAAYAWRCRGCPTLCTTHSNVMGSMTWRCVGIMSPKTHQKTLATTPFMYYPSQVSLCKPNCGAPLWTHSWKKKKPPMSTTR